MKTMMGNKGFAQLWMLVGLVVMAVALPVASVLVSKNQDNRNKAAGNSVCYPSNGTTVCYYPTDVPASPAPTNSFCNVPPSRICDPTVTKYGNFKWTDTPDSSGNYVCIGDRCNQVTGCSNPKIGVYESWVSTPGMCNSLPTPVRPTVAVIYGKCTSVNQLCITSAGVSGTCLGYGSGATFSGACVALTPTPIAVVGGGGGSAGGGVAPTSVVQATPTNASCFLPGTLISTSNGTKRIEEVKEGDVVLSFDNQNKVNRSVVSNLMNFSREYYYRLVAGSNEVKVTAEHPFYRGGGEFTQVKDLQVGDEVYLLKDGKMVEEVVSELQRVDEKTPVYNLTVETDHTYFANGFAVHNKVVAAPAQGLVCSKGDTAWSKCQSKAGSGGTLFGDTCPGGYTDKGKVYTWVPSTTVGGVTVQLPNCIAQRCCVSSAITNSQKLDACKSAKITLSATVVGTEVTVNGKNYSMKGKTQTIPVSGYGCKIPADQTCVADRADYAKDASGNVVLIKSSPCKIGTSSGNCCPPGKF